MVNKYIKQDLTVQKSILGLVGFKESKFITWKKIRGCHLRKKIALNAKNILDKLAEI